VGIARGRAKLAPLPPQAGQAPGCSPLLGLTCTPTTPVSWRGAATSMHQTGGRVCARLLCVQTPPLCLERTMPRTSSPTTACNRDAGLLGPAVAAGGLWAPRAATNTEAPGYPWPRWWTRRRSIVGGGWRVSSEVRGLKPTHTCRHLESACAHPSPPSRRLGALVVRWRSDSTSTGRSRAPSGGDTRGSQSPRRGKGPSGTNKVSGNDWSCADRWTC
jgi:hypothetical protein